MAAARRIVGAGRKRDGNCSVAQGRSFSVNAFVGALRLMEFTVREIVGHDNSMDCLIPVEQEISRGFHSRRSTFSTDGHSGNPAKRLAGHRASDQMRRSEAAPVHLCEAFDVHEFGHTDGGS